MEEEILEIFQRYKMNGVDPLGIVIFKLDSKGEVESLIPVIPFAKGVTPTVGHLYAKLYEYADAIKSIADKMVKENLPQN